MNPEYYKFVLPKKRFQTDSTSFTENKIYKIKHPENLEELGNFIDDGGSDNGFSNSNAVYFKPATEKEWLLQEGYILKEKENLDYLIEILKDLE